MKKLLLIAAAVLAGASGLRAQEYTAISPDGKITVTVSTCLLYTSDAADE